MPDKVTRKTARDVSTEGIADLVRRCAGYVTAVTGFLTGLINFIILLRGDRALATVILLGAGAAMLLGSLIYLRVSRVASARTTVRKGRETLWEHRYSQRVRRLAIVGILVMPLVGAAGYGIWRQWRKAPPNRIVILIADFESVDGEGYGVTQQVIEQLRSAVAQYAEVEIQALDRIITAKEGSKVARELGQDRNAGIVLWGWCHKSQVTVHFDLLMRPPGSVGLERDKETVVAVGVGLDESFSVQTQVSSDMAYLTLLTIGLVRYEVGDLDGAIERWQKALGLTTGPQQMVDPARLYKHLGDAYLYKGDFNSAIRHYTQAVETNPSMAVAVLNRGAAYYLSGDRARAADDSDRAITLLNEHLARNPGDAEAYYDRGIAYYHKGDMDRAIADFTAAVGLEPGFVFAFDNRAGAYAEKGDYERALADINESVRLVPTATGYFSRGNMHFQLRRYDLAVADYTRAIELDPRYVLAYDNRGVVYNRLGDVERAVRDFARAIELAPGFADPYHNRGLAYAGAGALDLAIADFSAAIARSPGDASILLHRGIANGQRGDFDKALADYELAIKLKPDYSKAFNNRGIVFAQRRDYRRAIEDFTRAIQLDPSNLNALQNRARAYEQVGESAKADADRLEFERLKPNAGAESRPLLNRLDMNTDDQILLRFVTLSTSYGKFLPTYLDITLSLTRV